MNPDDMLNLLEQAEAMSRLFGEGSGGRKPRQTPHMLEFALPFLGPRYQKPLGAWLKLREIENLLEAFSRLAKARFAGEGDWRRGMLEAVKPHACEENQRMIGFLLMAIDLGYI